MTERSKIDLGRMAGEVGTPPPRLTTEDYFKSIAPQIMESVRRDTLRATVAFVALSGGVLVVDVQDGVRSVFAPASWTDPVVPALRSHGEWAWVGRAR